MHGLAEPCRELSRMATSLGSLSHTSRILRQASVRPVKRALVLVVTFVLACSELSELLAASIPEHRRLTTAGDQIR
jgi:hypothetical protein